MNNTRLSEDASHPAITASTPCIKIDKGVPLPRKGHNGGRQAVYPWRQMGVGDSFVLRETVRSGKGMYAAEKLTGFKFSSRRIIENGKSVIRIWRVA